MIILSILANLILNFFRNMHGLEFVYYIVAVIILLAWCVFWGTVTSAVAFNKGHRNTVTWFFIGFFFDFFAFALVCSEPDRNITKLINKTMTPEEKEELKTVVTPVRTFKTVLPGKDWKCSCGRTNPSYVTSCICGADKDSPSSDSWNKDEKADK